MLFRWKIEDIVSKVLKENNIKEIKVTEGYCSLMAYTPSEKTIKYSKDNINKILILYPYIDKDKFIELATYHELGHHYSHINESISDCNRLEKELKAWKIGRKLIKNKVDIKYFDIINRQNMLLYIDKNKMNLLLFQNYTNWIKTNFQDIIEELKENDLSKIIKYKKNKYSQISKKEFIENIKCNFRKDICFELIYNQITESYLLILSKENEKYMVEISYYGEHNEPIRIYKIV
jgi:hypothetical protein